MLYLFGFMLSSFLYYKRNRIPHYLNYIYINVKKLKNYSSNKGFLKIKTINIQNTNTAIIEYKYKNNKFIMINNPNNILFPPYDINIIDNFHNDNSINNMVKNKDDIISAELIYNNGETKDVMNITQMLCDPICKFYKNTSNQIKTEHLINYLKYNKLYDDGLIYNIMTCDGNEFNLMNI